MKRFRNLSLWQSLWKIENLEKFFLKLTSASHWNDHLDLIDKLHTTAFRKHGDEQILSYEMMKLLESKSIEISANQSIYFKEESWRLALEKKMLTWRIQIDKHIVSLTMNQFKTESNQLNWITSGDLIGDMIVQLIQVTWSFHWIWWNDFTEIEVLDSP